MEPLVGLIRKFAVVFFNGQNAQVCPEIMEPDYVLRMGNTVIAGRDEHYVPAVQSQFEQFPGLTMTVHQVMTTGTRIAIHITEHGASGGGGGQLTAWSGIALYKWNGTKLTGCVAEEDYHARRRQLTTGLVDPIEAPATAPWDLVAELANQDAEDVVRRWLDTPSTVEIDGVVRDDEHPGLAPRLLFDVIETEVTDIFSAGAQVAFHAKQTGRYGGGFPPIGPSPRQVTLYSAGIVSVVDGKVQSGRVIRDRAGLHRTLRTT